MYQVFSDNNLIYDPNVPDLDIVSGKISLELNKTGSFVFTIYPSNPYYGALNKLKSVIKVYQDGYLIFKGRILNDKEGFNQSKEITCEGQLAYLLDSAQRPFDFTGTPADLFAQLIDNHNQQVDAFKQFKVGVVTVEDPNDYIARSDTEYTDTLTLLTKQLVDTLGGYINIRHENDGEYIDYLRDFDTINSQTIEFGENLTDLTRTTKGEDIATAIIPLGAKLQNEDPNDPTRTVSETRLNITEVNGGVDYVFDSQAVAKYGWIFKKMIWDDVTDATNLLKKGRDYLSDSINLIVSIDLTAVDLAGLKKDISNFRIGSYVHILSTPHDIEQNMLVKKLSIDLFKPSQNKLTLGVNYKTFLDQQVSLNGEMGNIVTQVENVTQNFTTNITQIENNVQSSINQSSEEILLKVEESYYKKDETNSMLSTMSTQLTQTSDRFEMEFNTLNKELKDLSGNSVEQFEQISKYIRFIDGNIVLGEVGNELTLRIENDKIVFLENTKEIAYFTNQKLYITDSEVTQSLTIGKFAFLPRDNGNLSFKKVG